MKFNNLLSHWPRWSALVAVFAFALYAGWPYLSALPKVLANENRPLSVENLQKQMKEDEKAAEEAAKRAERAARMAAGEYPEQKNEKAMRPAEARSVWVSPAGDTYAGTKGGLFLLAKGGADRIVYPGDYPRVIFGAPDGALYAGGKDGLFVRQGENWKKLYDGEVRTGGLDAAGNLFVATKSEGLLVREKGSSSFAPHPAWLAVYD
jgi:hypothetical protein